MATVSNDELQATKQAAAQLNTVMQNLVIWQGMLGRNFQSDDPDLDVRARLLDAPQNLQRMLPADVPDVLRGSLVTLRRAVDRSAEIAAGFRLLIEYGNAEAGARADKLMPQLLDDMRAAERSLGRVATKMRLTSYQA